MDNLNGIYVQYVFDTRKIDIVNQDSGYCQNRVKKFQSGINHG